MSDDYSFLNNSSLIHKIPSSLITRVQTAKIIFGIVNSAQDINQDENIIDLFNELKSLAPLPIHLVYFIPEEQSDKVISISDPSFETCIFNNKNFWHRLPQLEAVLLPWPAPAPELNTLFASFAIPILNKLITNATHWQGAGLAVAEPTPRELAALLLLLATDPPTRRRALDSQQVLLSTNRVYRWQVEGVFDSNYSLAIVNRRCALALEDTIENNNKFTETVALYTYEQGEDPQPNFFIINESSIRLKTMWERSRDQLPPYVALRNAWPPWVRDMRGERRVLANYAWEETGFPTSYAQDFNRTLDLITVVSTQTARFLQNAGVNVPIAIVGNGIDHLLDIVPEPLPRILPEGFRLLHVSSCFPRKGIDILLKAYGKAFRAAHNVVLIIKTFANPHNDLLDQLAHYRTTDSQYPQVEVIFEDWTPGQMVSLYKACQVLVAPSRGEGFGLPFAEAMLHEVPVIVTGWGGQLDFCNAETAWLIDYQLAPAQTHLAVPDSLWAEPDLDHLVTLLQQIYATPPANLQPRLTRIKQHILARYTWTQVAQRTRMALKVINAQPGPLPIVKIGWISTWGSRCGVAAYSAHLTQAFPSGTLTIFAPDDEVLEHLDPLEVIRNWRRGDLYLIDLIKKICELKLNAVVIQYHWAFFSVTTLTTFCETLHQHGIKIILELHNTRDAPSSIFQLDNNQALNCCDRILVHTLDDVKQVARWGLTTNVTLFPLAIYAIPLPSAKQRLVQRQVLGFSEKIVIATFGYLMPHKGLTQIIEALPKLCATHPKIHLLMINAWYSEPASAEELQRMRTLIKNLSLESQITLQIDYLVESEAINLLSLADLIVFPYQHSQESASAAVRMAIAARRPLAVTPLAIFTDLAPVTLQLPGITSVEIADGINDLLNQLANLNFYETIMQRINEFAQQYHAGRCSAQLRDLITGIIRQLPKYD